MAIENLVIQIAAVNSAGAALKAIEGRIDSIAGASEKVKQNFRSAISAAQGAATTGLITTNLGKNLVPAVKLAGDLQSSFLKLKKELVGPGIGFDQVQKDLDLIAEKSFQIQAVTPFDQQGIVEQAIILRKAGLSIQAIGDSALEATAKLATLEEMPPELAASIMSLGETAFGLSSQAGGFTRFADELAKASSLADLSAQDIGDSMVYAGAAAKRLGFTSRDTALAMASLATGGIKGGQAGTTFASIFRDLEKKRPDLVFDKATGKARPLGVILEKLNKEFQGLTDLQKSEKMSAIFQDESKKGVLALSESFGKFNSEMDKQASILEKIDILQGGFNAKWDSLTGTAKSTIASLYAPALAPLSKLVDLANEYTTAVGNATRGENSLGKAVSGMSAGALAVGGVATAGLAGLAGWKGLQTLRGVGGIKGLLSGGGGLAAGVAKGKLLSSITGGEISEVYVVNASEISGGVASALPGALGSAGGGAGAGAAGAAGGFFANLKGRLATLFPTFTKWGSAIGGALSRAGGAIKAAIFAVGPFLLKAFATAAPAVGNALLSAISAIGGSVLAVGGAIGLAVGGAIGYAFRDSIANFLEETLPGFSSALDKVLPKFGEAAKQEELVNNLKAQEAAAGERLRRAQEAKLAGSATPPGSAAVQNQISIQIDKEGRTIVDSGKSQTQVKTTLKPTLDR
jgi:TP901 family phage tail tape measure protein